MKYKDVSKGSCVVGLACRLYTVQNPARQQLGLVRMPANPRNSIISRAKLNKIILMSRTYIIQLLAELLHEIQFYLFILASKRSGVVPKETETNIT